MTPEQTQDRIRSLLMKLEDCEQECHAVSFHAAAHNINAAKNSVGWEFAQMMERRQKAQTIGL